MSRSKDTVADLLPCPFCGKRPKKATFATMNRISGPALVQCECSAIGPVGETREIATENWNRRMAPPPDLWECAFCHRLNKPWLQECAWAADHELLNANER